MKKNYDFHPDLRKYEKMKVPVIPAVIPRLQALMSVLYHMEKSDERVSVSAIRIPSEDGSMLRALVYEPKFSAQNSSCLLFFHGGGFVYNASPHHFRLARRFTEMTGCKTILVDYRLAPAHKFPAAADDCFDVYRWVLGQVSDLKIDPCRIAVCGDSAGGNLAAALCLMARDRDIPMPKAQLLLYPVTDCRMETESMRRYTDTPLCKRGDIEKYFEMYLPAEKPDIHLVPYVSPVEAESLKGLPDTYIEVAEFDCLHDEGAEFARLLAADGVWVELHEMKGAMHGYDIAGSSGFVKDCMDLRLRFLESVDFV